MGTITTSLLEGCGRGVDANIHAVLFGRGRSHLNKERRQLSVGKRNSPRRVFIELQKWPHRVRIRRLSFWRQQQQSHWSRGEISRFRAIGESHRKNSRSVLEGIGQPRHAGVVGETGVAVARWQRGVEERLLRGVVRLGLVLLGLSQRCGRSRRRRVPAAKLGQVP